MPKMADASGGATLSDQSIAGGARAGAATRHRNATVVGFVASVLAGAAFVSYAVVVSRETASSKYANLVLYSKPAKTPEFDLPRLGGGGAVTSASLAGGPAVVNWFRSTCTACQGELGTFASVARAKAGKIRFLGVDERDPSPGTALAMLRRAGVEYPVAQASDADFSFATSFGVGDLPATVFVSPEGNILGEILGRVSRSELDDVIDNLTAGRPLNS
jgi:thiol-disulfide isomerase/thioredoxin